MKRLSKSRYISGKQCHLKLWYDCDRRDLKSEITDAQQAIFDTGHAVGILACERFPGGVLVEQDYTQPDAALAKTHQLLAKPMPAIFEAAFLHDNVLIRADILQRLGSGDWVLQEVKSSTGVKETHYDDVAVQHYVLKGAGIDISSCGIVTLNRDYIYDGITLDLDNLFTFHDLTEDAVDMADEVAANLVTFNSIISSQNAPVVEPGEHCTDPYECPYLAHCTII